MKIELSPELRSFRAEVRRYMDEVVMTADFVAELSLPAFSHGGGPVYWQKMARLGADGWIRRSWPAELGGGGADALQQYLLVDEAKRAGVPWPSLSANSIGPVLARHAREPLREQVVGEILRGEAYLAIGYSEPSAGSDLASLRTRAERVEGGWRINGNKIWTSCANFARYIWLAARTDADASLRHKGLSVFLVPTASPGYSCTPIHTLGVETCATYYQDVFVPDSHLIGELNGGWPLITGQLNLERLSLVSHGHVARLYDETCALLRNDARFQPLLAQAWVRRTLAEAKTKLDVLELICLRAAWTMQQGGTGMVEASVAKVYGSELYVTLGHQLNEILGQSALVAQGPGLLADGFVERWYRRGSVHTFGGGANELQRGIVAQAGLRLPR